MEPPNPSFADEFLVPQEDAVLVFDVRRAVVSLPFQVHRVKVLVEVGWSPSRVRVSSLQTKSQNKLSTAALRTFRRFFPAIFTTFRRLLLWGSARRCLLASIHICTAAFLVHNVYCSLAFRRDQLLLWGLPLVVPSQAQSLYY